MLFVVLDTIHAENSVSIAVKAIIYNQFPVMKIESAAHIKVIKCNTLSNFECFFALSNTALDKL
ncbi:hypothetical protein VCRA2122O128_250004 [Vibrio crassostreae]|nr:hypothetical protein VCRA2122O128_250004 [Vibrio crassostreae]